MKVFISWSGDSSRDVARALRGWQPKALQFVDPFMSETDIDKGTRWATEVSAQLEAAKVGIICLTPGNLFKPWLLFESGALSKTLSSTYVCTYLLGPH